MAVALSDARKLVGKHIYALDKRGRVVSGKLVSIKGHSLYVRPANAKGQARTKAIIPLVLFDLLAIGTSPFSFGFSPFGFNPSGFGFSPFIW